MTERNNRGHGAESLEDRPYDPGEFGLKNSSRAFRTTLAIAFVLSCVIAAYLYLLMKSQAEINIVLDKRKISDENIEVWKRAKESIQGINTIILVAIPMIFTYFLDGLYSLLSYKINPTMREVDEREYESINLKLFSGVYIVLLFIFLIVYSIFSDTTFIVGIQKSFLLSLLVFASFTIISILAFEGVNRLKKKKNANLVSNTSSESDERDDSNTSPESDERDDSSKKDRVIIFLWVAVIILLITCAILSLMLQVN